MTKYRRDNSSGALIFYKTDEEKELDSLKEEISRLSKQIEELKKSSNDLK